MLTREDVRAIELATTASVVPRVRVEDDGWLLLASDGRVGRANCVVPLDAGADPLEAKLDRAFVFYAAQGLPPSFRVAEHALAASLAEGLSARGLRPEQPSRIMVAEVAKIDRIVTAGRPADLVTPGEDWKAVFLGPGFDPDDGRSRADMLLRAPDTLYAQATLYGAAAAVGALSVWRDWAGLQGMRTRADARRRGLAHQVIAALAAAAADRGVRRLYLSVEAANTPARNLYERLGFADAWGYDYWRPGVAASPHDEHSGSR